jgi:hypothetical protein
VWPVVSKIKIIKSRGYLRKNLKRKWVEERPDVFVYESLSLFTEIPKWILCNNGVEIATGDYGTDMMKVIKDAVKKEGVKL